MRDLRWLPKTFLALAVIGVFFAGFLSPYRYDQQNRAVPLAPPTGLHLWNEHHQLTRPYVYRLTETSPGSGVYKEDQSSKYVIRFFVNGARYTFAGATLSIHLFGVDAPGTIFLMGTDEFGRDLFTRILYGGQTSLLIGLLAGFLALLIALLVGGFAGHFGGWTDEGLMALAELFLSLPWLYMLFAARAVLPLRLGPGEAVIAVVIPLAVAGWARPARIVRGVILSAKQSDYVSTARGFGASEWYLLRKHELPQARSAILAHAALLVPGYILAETTLSFVGLGINEPNVSWGSLLISLQHYDIMASCWWMWLPVIYLTLLIGCSCALIGGQAYASGATGRDH